MAYKTNIKLSNISLAVLKQGKILSDDETFEMMLTRVSKTLSRSKNKRGKTFLDLKLQKQIYSLMMNKYIVYSTPILTNAGRFTKKPLSACTAPASLDWNDLAKVRKIVCDTHQSGMGTGYCLDEYKDPIHILNILNRFAIESAESGKEDRPVGNMATLSVYHPKIEKFINYKSRNLEVMEWKFNLAINVDKYFLEQARKGKNFKLSNGKVKNAKDILRKIADNNFTCGDPGLLFLDNLNKENPAAFLGEYKTVAPCGEVGLLPGEACQFGYINLARFAKDNKELDWKKMSLAVSVLVRSLDNALDITIRNLTDKTSKELIRQKRKIGIGICGLSELFINLNIPYDSRKAQKIARDIMAFVNYSSKEESHSLAKEKGSCKAMDHIECGYRNGFLLKYAKNTRKVSKKMWVELHDKIAATLKLRNIITTALPPTGRSALVIDTSTGIEPTFSIYDHGGEIRSDLSRLLAGLNLSQEDIAKIKSTGKLNRKIPRKIRRIYKTALQIPVKKHLSMVSTIQEYVDESISKTVNLPENCTTQEMINAMHLAYDNGLKGISLYRSNSRKLQPRKL